MSGELVGVLGGTSMVGEYLLQNLFNEGKGVAAFSRDPEKASSISPAVSWFSIEGCGESCSLPYKTIRRWISLAPIWGVSDHLLMLERYGAKRLVVLSSTSRFTKKSSSDVAEQELVSRLVRGEEGLLSWGERAGVEVVILRPTLIYGGGKDKNISEIAQFIKRFGFFPILGQAGGGRQPIHGDDVAIACIKAIYSSHLHCSTYNISGGELLSYKNMVVRVFEALSIKPRVLSIPMPIFKVFSVAMRLFPRYRHWSLGMVERMNSDLVFDSSDAVRDFGFSPRPFSLDRVDLL